MRRRRLDELAHVDPRVAHFGRHGLMLDRRLTDDAAIDFVQALVLEIELPSVVPDAVRAHYDVLRDLHVYGAFQPEFFAIVVTQASLTLEHALGARFIDWHGGRVPLTRSKTGQIETVEVDDFARLTDRFRSGWRLAADGRFDGSLASLLRWAHGTGLMTPWLSGIWRRSKASIQVSELVKTGPERRVPPDWERWGDADKKDWWESTFRPMWETEHLDNERALRNLLAHRTSRFLTIPPDSARALQSLAEIITSLWDDTSDAPDAT